jgi:hypothetical protein
VGEAAAPNGRCNPILPVPSLFRVELGGTKEVYDVRLGKESPPGWFLVSSMGQVLGMRCLGRRYGEMGDGRFVLSSSLRIGKLRKG